MNFLKRSLIYSFVIVVCAVLTMGACLLFDFAHRQANDPFEDARYVQLRQQVLDNSSDPGLREQLQTLDVQLRKGYFQSRQWMYSGAVLALLLLAGLVVLGRIYSRFLILPETPDSAALTDQLSRKNELAFETYCFAFLAVTVGLLVVYIFVGTELTQLGNVDNTNVALTERKTADGESGDNTGAQSQSEASVDPVTENAPPTTPVTEARPVVEEKPEEEKSDVKPVDNIASETPDAESDVKSDVKSDAESDAFLDAFSEEAPQDEAKANEANTNEANTNETVNEAKTNETKTNEAANETLKPEPNQRKPEQPESIEAAASAESSKTQTASLEPEAVENYQPVPIPEGQPTSSENAQAWPQFRGVGGAGNATNFKDLPVEWDAASGKNILWKSPVPLPGFNSPVIWNDRLFVTGATDQKREVYCYALADGKLFWKRDVPATKQSAGQKFSSDHAGFAACTGATDGRRFYACFANGDVTAVDFNGQLVWTRGLGVPKNVYGHASSLILDGERLIVQMDQGDQTENLSRLYALNVLTGETVWEAKRDGLPNCWSTPVVLGEKLENRQIVCSGSPYVVGYEAATGKELWRAKTLRADVGPTPVCANGKVFSVSEFPQLSAIDPNLRGDITDKILWKGDSGLPDTVSPLVFRDFVMLLDSSATLTCYDQQSGELVWDSYAWGEDEILSLNASPIWVKSPDGQDLIYLFADAEKESADGKPTKCSIAYILKINESGDGVEVLHKNWLNEPNVSSPAVQNGRLFIRGQNYLWSIGK